MAEPQQEREARELRELEGKNVAHYQTLLGAWIETRMERDRTLITLSTGAIGLLFTVLITVGLAVSWEIWLYTAALVAFVGTVGTLLVVFKKNSDLIESELQGEGHRAPSLLKYDVLATVLFIFGVVSSAGIGLIEAICR